MSGWLKQIFPFMKVKKKKEFSYIIRGVDPHAHWEILGELGDGSFGKVYKVGMWSIVSCIPNCLSFVGVNNVLQSILKTYGTNRDIGKRLWGKQSHKHSVQ